MISERQFLDVPDARRRLMGRVKSTDTKPEIKVRRLVYALGHRFRLHRSDLPGKPDLVFPGKKKVIFVHGCFWHRHAGCHRTTSPKTRAEYWQDKFDENVRRDAACERELLESGWAVLTVWECEVDDECLAGKIVNFLRE